MMNLNLVRMKLKLIIVILSIYSLAVNGSLNVKDSISITYIANCGFLIEMDSKKMIIDGLFKEGYNHYSVPDSGTQVLLTSNRKPFNDIDLILVSHVHGDHFDSEMVIDCMMNNPDAKLICPEQVADKIREHAVDYEKIKSRIIECTPDTFTVQQVKTHEIEITACRLAHGHQRHKDIQNIGYLIHINGKTLFHTGDADPHQIDKLTGIKLSEKNIDVGLINDGFGHMKNAEITKKYINAHYNVIMHLPEEISKIWMEPLKENPDLFSNPFVFTKMLENKVFLIENE